MIERADWDVLKSGGTLTLTLSSGESAYLGLELKKYFKENKIHNINTDHDENSIKDDVYMIESYIVDDRNKSNLFPDLPEGSWVATYLVENDEVWDKIKSGEYNGFSLEGYFIEKYEDDMVDNMLLEIQSTLRDYVDEDLIEEKIKRILGMK